MKYVIILADGMSDYPIAELGNKTPMEYANKPVMDEMARKGEVFLVKTVPDNLTPGSDIANLSVMGYDPQKHYSGRSPLEAASIGVSLGADDTSYRANLVTLSGKGEYESLTIKDHSAGEIETRQAAELIHAVADKLETDSLRFYKGVSYRHLMVRSDKIASCTLTPPHDILDKEIQGYLPDDAVILDIMKKSYDILKTHPVNIKRRVEGKNTADSLWIWGAGKRISLPSFTEKYGCRGAVISAVDLVRGIGYLAGMEVILVEGATGNIDTDFEGKAHAALRALSSGCDFVYIHLEAPDECGHQGQARDKAKAIELIDQRVVKIIKEGLESSGEDLRIMILPDHPTPVSTRTHARDAVPCLLYDSRKSCNGPDSFTEKTCAGKLFQPGFELMSYFLEKGKKGNQ